MNMKHHTKLTARIAILAALCSVALCSAVLLLASCHKSEGDTQGSDTQSSGSGGINSAMTAVPRYDYFEPEVAKDVTLDKSAYTDMKLTIPSSLLVTEEDVQAQIKNMIFKKRTADNGTIQVKDQPLKLGDSAFIYYRGTVDGEEIKNSSNMDAPNPHELGLGSGGFISGEFIPGFEEGLVGVVPDQTSKENPYPLHVILPEGYGEDGAWGGKEAIFYVVVEYAIQYTIPDYNRQVVVDTLYYEPKKDSYEDDGELLREFEAHVKVQLEKSREESIYYAKVNALWTHLTEAAQCQNLPQMELDFYYDSYVAEIQYYYEMYSYYQGEEFTKLYPDVASFAPWYLSLDKDANWEEELKNMSTKMVKKDMICHAIAEAEGMESVTDEEFQKQLSFWVEEYEGYMSENDVLQSMGELYLREAAFREKMGDWLLERASFSYGE